MRINTEHIRNDNTRLPGDTVKELLNNWQTRKFISDGEIYTINSGYQFLTSHGFDVDGDLIVDGDFCEI